MIERWEKEGWPFFVKNMENVQVDERDVIFISSISPNPTRVLSSIEVGVSDVGNLKETHLIAG